VDFTLGHFQDHKYTFEKEVKVYYLLIPEQSAGVKFRTIVGLLQEE
jgi:hypothetical protein